ncbi:MAG: tetratricopeptide repeat protein, partial [Candidatus Acidiferrum sp.]
LISGTSKSPSITVSMVPAADKKAVKVRVGSASVSSKAVKESERALHSLQLNNLADAQQHLERALAFEQDYSEADYLMGLLLLRQKDPARAAGYLQKSLALSPDQAPALLALSQAQYLQQDYPAATVSLERFLRDYPHDPQASNAQKYLDSMQKSRTANAGAMESAAESTPSGPSDNPPAAAGTAAATTDLPSLLESFAESNTWAPPNVDDEKIDIDASSAPCKLDSVLHSAGQRVRELVQNVDRFTATENLEHTNLNRMGLKTYSETRKFNYLVEIRPVDTTGINVEEYRNGSDSARQFPEEITTSGLPALAMIFHPNLQTRYEFDCQGRSTWGGRPAWVVRFEQRSGQNSSMLTYQVGKRYYAVGLKGRAWIDAANSQVMAMESDIMRPVPEIHLVRDHQLIEYGPVHFQNKSLELWLPKSADWYCSLNGKRFHRRHTFSKFMLFSVDDKQNISAPVVVPAENTQQPSGSPPATY